MFFEAMTNKNERPSIRRVGKYVALKCYHYVNIEKSDGSNIDPETMKKINAKSVLQGIWRFKFHIMSK